MFTVLKKLVRRTFDNERFPAIQAYYYERDLRKKLAQCERKSRMTYTEIEAAISQRYEEVFGRKLDWDNPKTYTEKINVSKVYMSSPLKTLLADKYRVCEWIREKLGSEYLIPILGVYDSFDEIDFDSLPSQFVMKCNHDSGSVTIVTDKSRLDMRSLKLKYDFCMRRNYAYSGFEMHYRDVKPKILIEQYIDDAAVNDYRFFCFDEKPYYCAVDFHNEEHKISERNFYGMNWELCPFALNYPNHIGEISCPYNFDELKEIALKLCQGIDHVRVDLYSAGGRIYFGEMTFAHANGFQKFTPSEWDYRFGALWPFDNSIRSKVLNQK